MSLIPCRGLLCSLAPQGYSSAKLTWRRGDSAYLSFLLKYLLCGGSGLARDQNRAAAGRQKHRLQQGETPLRRAHRGRQRAWERRNRREREKCPALFRKLITGVEKSARGSLLKVSRVHKMIIISTA